MAPDTSVSGATSSSVKAEGQRESVLHTNAIPNSSDDKASSSCLHAPINGDAIFDAAQRRASWADQPRWRASRYRAFGDHSTSKMLPWRTRQTEEAERLDERLFGPVGQNSGQK